MIEKLHSLWVLFKLGITLAQLHENGPGQLLMWPTGMLVGVDLEGGAAIGFLYCWRLNYY